MGERNWRKERPVRHALGTAVYRLIWWPVVAVAAPFVLIGMFVSWLEWTAFPAIASFFQPAFGGAHKVALAAGNGILGCKPKDQNDD